MKSRLGWVSNSSSSSFICVVCGDVEVGYDNCASDFDMTEFECGHTVCDSEFSIDLEDLTFDQKKQLVDDNDRYDIENKVEKDRFQGRYGRALTDEEQIVHAKAIKEVFDARPKEHYEDIDFEEFMEELDETPRVFCPVCNLAHLSDKIVLQYIVNTQSISVEELKETIRDKFKTLDDVKKFLGE